MSHTEEPPHLDPAKPTHAPREGLLASAIHRLRDKTVGYWIVAIIVLIAAKAGSPFVYDYLNLTKPRALFFQTLLDWGPRPAEPRQIKIVRIENDEYWEGPLAGRRPIKRDYLANLVNRLVALNAHVIALDFDVRLPNPDSLDIPEDYRSETRLFTDAIKAAARQGKKIVLATPVSSAGGKIYRQDSDIYHASGLCLKPDKLADLSGTPDPIMSNVTCGYIALPYDPLRIPPPIEMLDGREMDPFALAVARAVNPELISRLMQRKTELVYLDFITHDMFVQVKAIFSARAVRLGTIDQSAPDSKAVIVGASWSRDAANRGPYVDLHSSPVGAMVGEELHANYAEAFLDSRVFAAVSKGFLDVAEIVFGISAAIAFALIPNLWGKALGLLALTATMFAISALALRAFGVFFDAFVPLVGLGIHALYESYTGHSENTETGNP
jgi:CHASE2 domain-containing sensor protein